jgi:anti-sigma B factor antagonist
MSVMPDGTIASPLTFDIEREGGVATVRCHGKLVAGVSELLYATVCQLIPGSKRIVLDLTDLAYMDSMGLGALVRLYVSAKSGGCSLELINLGKRIREMLGMTNLLSVLTTMCEQGISVRF